MAGSNYAYFEPCFGAKHLQFLAGCHPVVYWSANYCWDMLIFLVPTALSIIIFLCFQADAYTGASNIGCLILLFVLFGFSVTPLMYPATYLFDTPATAYVALTAFNLFIGINTTIAVSVMMAIIESDPDLTYIYEILDSVLLIFPHFCLGRGLIQMAIEQAYDDAYAELGFERERPEPILSFNQNGRCLVAMAVETVVFFAFALLCQYNFFCGGKVIKLSPHDVSQKDLKIDPDVRAESERVYSQSNRDIMKVKGLSKVFKERGTAANLVAVNRLTFSVPRGECFGLLGVNGAGKTTTFRMLTTEVLASGGDATIAGLSIVSDVHQVKRRIGYCPQFDGLNPSLTAAEHVRYYAKLRGIEAGEIDDVIDWVIAELDLEAYRNIPAGQYSGGNKRKLSTAIAFTGT